MTTILTTIGDLAEAKLDSGHLAGVVRDALATHHLEFDDVAAVLQPYAHLYAAPLGDGSQMVERLLDEAGVPASTVRLGQHALNQFRQQGVALMDTAALNASVARAMEPLLRSPAVTQALQQMQETFGAIRTDQLRVPVAALNAAAAGAMEPLLHSPAVEETTRRIRESLGAAAADAFPNAALRAITDRMTAQQSPLLENLRHAIAATNTPITGSVGGGGPARTAPGPTTASPVAGQRKVAAPKKAKVKKGKRSEAAASTSSP